MPRQLFVAYGIDAERIDPNAFIRPGDDVFQHGVVYTGIVAEVLGRSPVGVPACVKQQKLCLFYFVSIGPQAIHRNRPAFLYAAAVNDQGLADKLAGIILIQRRASVPYMGWRIGMGADVRADGNLRFFEAVRFAGTYRLQGRLFRSRKHGHMLPYGMGQIDNLHNKTPPRYVYSIHHTMKRRKKNTVGKVCQRYFRAKCDYFTTALSIIAMKSSTFRLAPPTRPPSISGEPVNSATLPPFTLPP